MIFSSLQEVSRFKTVRNSRSHVLYEAVSEWLKWLECEHGIGGKDSPVCHIPELNHVQDALEKNKKMWYFKLTSPTPEQSQGGNLGAQDS